MTCYCCGQDRDPSMMAALQSHSDVMLCRQCLGWLVPRAGGIDVTPTLPVTDMPAAVRFYETAGFDVEPYDGGFAFVHLHDQSAFDLDLKPEIDAATNGAGCYIIVQDVDEWHERLEAAGLPVTAVEDMPWNMHEFTLTDPDGNHIRIGRSSSGSG
jgi:catechol 2,3-dioxygenase-like lactoylglutathione lyase family enzyme